MEQAVVTSRPLEAHSWKKSVCQSRTARFRGGLTEGSITHCGKTPTAGCAGEIVTVPAGEFTVAVRARFQGAAGEREVSARTPLSVAEAQALTKVSLIKAAKCPAMVAGVSDTKTL